MTKIIYSVMTTLLALSLFSCTTAMYSDPTPVAKNRYEFFIATGGFSGAATADQRAVQEINNFMTKRGYSKYKIIKRTDKFIPSGFEYIVEFSK